MARSRLHELSERGVAVWFDTLSRDLVASGTLARMMEEDAVTGVTSNPTIFQKALAEGTAYDDQLRELGGDPKDAFFALALDDISNACDVLRPVWDDGKGLHGWVSMEVDPTLAYDTEATLEQALWIAATVDKPNLYVKIPATEEGLPAIEESIAQGVSVNVTLIFGLERYAAVVEAYIRGVERFVASGGDARSVASVASFFVSRVDTETDNRLWDDALKGKLAVANAKLAYRHFLDTFSGPRWQELEDAGASKQWCLWASTSTKNPAYRDVVYVEELIAPDTVNTMPLETIRAFQDHGEVRGDTALEGLDEARALLDELRAAGIDYDDVVETLEAEGVQKFVDSFHALIDGLRAKQGELAAR